VTARGVVLFSTRRRFPDPAHGDLRIHPRNETQPPLWGGAPRWIDRRRLRYKRFPALSFDEIKDRLKTGDIILFHKTTRSSLLDAIELDFVSPLFFQANEFRHSGVILRDGDDIQVLECAEESHSGYSAASYPTGGNGIRIVPLEPLLEAYTQDNGLPHYGVRLISREIPHARIIEVLNQYGPVNYLKMQRSIPLFLTKFLVPDSIRRRLLHAYRHEMMCSEFVHSVLNRCGALADYPSKLLAPYSIEDDRFFRRLEIVPFSEIIRFTWPSGTST
jgi:hypothetical protein